MSLRKSPTQAVLLTDSEGLCQLISYGIYGYEHSSWSVLNNRVDLFWKISWEERINSSAAFYRIPQTAAQVLLLSLWYV